jgi:hypothetical protein
VADTFGQELQEMAWFRGFRSSDQERIPIAIPPSSFRTLILFVVVYVIGGDYLRPNAAGSWH